MEILIALDLHDGQAKALADFACRLLPGLKAVHLLHVAPPDSDFVGYENDPPVMREQIAAAFHREHRLLQSIAGDLRHSGVNAKALLVQGETVPTIVAQADKLNVDLIVAGAHEHGAVYQLLLGDVAQELLRESGKPVLTVPLRALRAQTHPE